jgi:hypothetical protein
MTCKQCAAIDRIHGLNLALDDDMLYRKLAALRTYGDYANLIANLEMSELAHYGAYSSSAVSQVMGWGRGVTA